MFDNKKMLCYNPIFDSLEIKNGYNASKIRCCSRFWLRSDMCYISAFDELFSLVCLMILLIVDFLMNS